MLLENFWLIGSAGAFGLAACIKEAFFAFGYKVHFTSILWNTTSGLLVTFWLLIIVLVSRLVTGDFADRWTSIRIFILGMLVWSLIGLSFWLILPPDERILVSITSAIGAFALGWLGGYLVPFAPAGLGVREVIIVALIADQVSIPIAVAAVTFNRLLYTGTDLTLGGMSSLWYDPLPQRLDKP